MLNNNNIIEPNSRCHQRVQMRIGFFARKVVRLEIKKINVVKVEQIAVCV